MAQGTFISVGAILEKYSNIILSGLQRTLKETDHIASFKLYQSISVNVKIYGFTYSMQISMEDYWQYVEFGRQPGGKQPPPEEIIKWTVQKGFSMEEVAQSFRRNAALARRAKGIQPREFTNIRRSARKLNREATRKSLAFLIGRNIAEEGIEPSYFASEILGGSLVNEGIASGGIWDKLTKELEDEIGKQIELNVIL